MQSINSQGKYFTMSIKWDAFLSKKENFQNITFKYNYSKAEEIFWSGLSIKIGDCDLNYVSKINCKGRESSGITSFQVFLCSNKIFIDRPYSCPFL